MLTPRDLSDRLGISVTTVNNWRHRNKLFSVRFDYHQNMYPAWQFVESPADGDSGVVRHLDEIFNCFGDVHPWDKARFLLASQPLFGGRSPLEVLRRGAAVEIDLLKDLSSHSGEIGACALA